MDEVIEMKVDENDMVKRMERSVEEKIEKGGKVSQEEKKEELRKSIVE